MLLNRLEEASRELQEAVRRDPQDADSLAHLAYCEAKLGRVEEARPRIAAALRLDPGNVLARQLAAALGKSEMVDGRTCPRGNVAASITLYHLPFTICHFSPSVAP